jgi:deoxynucleoside triphosphate triphosphohydrolase SAMHD1
VLVDDNISSAKFFSWSGMQRDRWPIECQDEAGIFQMPLPAETFARMRKRPIYVAVCAGRESATATLGDALAQLSFSNLKGVKYKHSIEHEPEWPTDLHRYLEQVGLSLMAWAQFRKPPGDLGPDEHKYCADRAFGYANVGGLVATNWNVPTATATPIWCPGLHSGAPWLPLLIRRNKLRHLVIG